MAISEEVCWKILRRPIGLRVTFTLPEIKKSETLENAFRIADVEKELVLNYSKSTIEDSMYFMEKRGYLDVLSWGLIAPRSIYKILDAGLSLAISGRFPDEEKESFDEGILFQNRNDLITQESKYPQKLWMLAFKWMAAYGESPVRVAVSAFVVIAICATIYASTGVWSNLINEKVFSIPTSLYFSVVTFTTLGYGDYSPVHGIARITATIEALCGMFLMSLFLVTLVRRFGRS